MRKSSRNQSPNRLSPMLSSLLLGKEVNTPEGLVDALVAKYADISLATRTELLAAAAEVLSCTDAAEQAKAVGALAIRIAGLQSKITSVERESGLAEKARHREIDVSERRALLEKERVSKGLQRRARTGTAERQCSVFQIPVDELPSAKDVETQEQDRRGISNDVAGILKRVPLGQSRLGGLPDLPVEVTWPTHDGKKIPFIAQINVSELLEGVDFPLPKDGHLFVFALIAGNSRYPQIPVSLFLWRGSPKSLVRANPCSKDEIWQDWAGKRVYDMVLVGAPPELRGVKRIQRGMHGPGGWLFGRMFGLIGSPGEIATEMFADGDDWINLLAVESVGSMSWSDAGHLYFLIRKSALLNLDFSNVLAAVRSS